MTDQDRIVQAARQNGWHLRVDQTSGTVHHYAKGSRGVTVSFNPDGSVKEAMLGGSKVSRSKAASTIQYLRGK